jgi:hypothetical protein
LALGHGDGVDLGQLRQEGSVSLVLGFLFRGWRSGVGGDIFFNKISSASAFSNDLH